MSSRFRRSAMQQNLGWQTLTLSSVMTTKPWSPRTHLSSLNWQKSVPSLKKFKNAWCRLKPVWNRTHSSSGLSISEMKKPSLPKERVTLNCKQMSRTCHSRRPEKAHEQDQARKRWDQANWEGFDRSPQNNWCVLKECQRNWSWHEW